MNKAIVYFMQFTGLISKITEKDLKNILEEIDCLSNPTKNEIINVIREYYNEKYGEFPTFGFLEGQEFNLASYYLNLIKKELEKGKNE